MLSLVPELLVNIAHIGKVNEGELGHSRIGDERPPTERSYLRGSFSSFDRSARNSASVCFPANCAAVSGRYPSPVILMPNGLLLRRITSSSDQGTRRVEK
jgi:hypothetical protein